jgi:hypothetical protein
MVVAGGRLRGKRPGREDAGMMPPPGGEFNRMRSILIALGILLLVAGILWPLVSRYLGRLPGDVVVRRPGFTFVFPVVTCLIVSLVLSLLLWLLRR